MEIDKRLVEYILHKCIVNIDILSKQTNINYHFLYQAVYGTRKLKDSELDVLHSYLKEKTSLSDTYINKRINKVKRRNKSIKR